MTNANGINHESAPIPILGPGDWVRLERPYIVAPPQLTRPLKNTLGTIAKGRGLEVTASLDAEVLAEEAYRAADYEDLFKFTHGIVTDLIEFTPDSEGFPDGMPPDVRSAYREADTRPPLRVSLHPYNAKTGVLYHASDPTEQSRPVSITTHICNLTLLQKAGSLPEKRSPISLSELYDRWGYALPDELP